MSKLLSLYSKVRFWNSSTSDIEEVVVTGFGHPPIIRVTRSSNFREEDRRIEIKESEIMETFNSESCLWEKYPGFNKEIPTPC